jgi:hypothetical protein
MIRAGRACQERRYGWFDLYKWHKISIKFFIPEMENSVLCNRAAGDIIKKRDNGVKGIGEVFLCLFVSWEIPPEFLRNKKHSGCGRAAAVRKAPFRGSAEKI